jgi:hypothetical protein
MAHARYLIVENDGTWTIRFQDEEFGPYQTQAEAMLFAVDAAKKFEKTGGSAQVCVVELDGHARPEWTSESSA